MESTEPRKLNVLCLGAGAIGTYIGGSLLLSGQRVVFLERPELAENLRKQGLRLKLNGTEHKISSPRIVAGMGDAIKDGIFDLAILAVKSFDTSTLMEFLGQYTDALPPILCLQNGVENETRIAEFLGEGRVIAGVVTSAISRRGAGDVSLERLRGVGISADHPLSNELTSVFGQAGLRPMLISNPLAMKWSKMFTNLIANASSAILDMTPREIFDDRRLFQMEIRMLREALSVMRALDLPVVNLPGTPVKMLSLAVRILPPWLSQMVLSRAVGAGRGAKMPSFHIDLEAGTGKSEVDYLNGAVVRFGEKLNVDTPVNRILTSTLLDLTEGSQRRENFARQPGKLLSLLPAH